MAHLNAEKLIILADLGNGLLNRFHNLINMPKPEAMNAEVDKFLKVLCKKFPEWPAVDTGKLTNYTVFFERSSQLVSQLEGMYNTFLDLMSFNRLAWELLMDLAATLTDLKHDLNQDIMTYYMNLLVRYVKLQILVSRIKDRRVYIMSYARAFQCANGNSEPNFDSLSEYIIEYDKPIRKMQETMQILAPKVAHTLAGYMMPLNSWAEVDMLVNKRVLNIMEDPKAMTVPKRENEHLTLIQLTIFKEWVLYGYLVCPDALIQPGASALLQTVLKELYLVEVHREETLDVHAEFDALAGWFKGTHNGDKISLKKQRKAFKECQDWDKLLARHQSLRSYLRVEMSTLIAFFNEFPHCLAPKIQLVNCILHMARDEVIWYLRHQGELPFKAKQNKFHWVGDAFFSELLYDVVTLSELITTHATTIQAYYMIYLKTIDLQGAKQALENFAQNQKLAPAHANLVTLILQDLQQANGVNSSFEGMRLNWYRLSAAMTHASLAIPLKAAKSVSDAMASVITHSRNVDCLGSQLKAHGSLQTVYWYLPKFKSILEQSLLMAQGQPGHGLAFVKVLNHALHNIHRNCPEEGPIIGKQCVQTADTFLRTVVMAMEKMLKNIMAQTNNLRVRAAQGEVLVRLQESEMHRKQKTDDGPHRPRPLPGFESRHENRRMTQPLRVWRQAISHICQSIRRSEQIVVYNIAFVPREYLYASMQTNIRTTLLKLVPDEKTREMRRPVHLLCRFRYVIYAYQDVQKHLDLNMSNIIREAMMLNFCDQTGTVPGAGEELVQSQDTNSTTQAPPEDTKLKSVIGYISKWYCAKFSVDLGAHGVYFARPLQSFLGRPVVFHRGSPPVVWLEASRYTDRNALISLCTLIGPAGVRVLERDMLKIVDANIAPIKKIIQDNQTAVTALGNQFAERNQWMSAHHRLTTELDSLLKHATSIGCVLKFISLLRTGLKDACRSYTDPMLKLVSLAHSQAHLKTPFSEDFANLDFLAADFGVTSKETPHSMMQLCKKYKVSQSDTVLWNLLPELFGMSFASKQWAHAKYMIDTDAFTNNAGCMAEAIVMLIVTFQRLRLPNERDEDVEVLISQQLERFVRCAAYSILHLHAGNKGAKAHDQRHTTSTIMVVLEQAINATDGRLPLSLLEDCFPYTLLRTNYITLYQKLAQARNLTEHEEEEQKPADGSTPAANPDAAAAAKTDDKAAAAAAAAPTDTADKRRSTQRLSKSTNTTAHINTTSPPPPTTTPAPPAPSAPPASSAPPAPSAAPPAPSTAPPAPSTAPSAPRSPPPPSGPPPPSSPPPPSGPPPPAGPPPTI